MRGRYALSRVWRWRLGLLAGLSGIGLLSACSPGYILRAGYEEARILWHRRPLAEILAQPDLDPATREKLEFVLRARDFAEREIGFNVGGRYASLSEVTSPPIVHVVTAAPRTSLEPYTWWFPIVGRVAYKGYFQAGEAQDEAQGLAAKGYDTYIRQASAFSTLGWFDDPLLPHLLRYDQETLANIIFHELFHSSYYLKGHTAFNESLANFAGHRAAILFFAKEYGQEAQATRNATASWRRELRMSAFLAQATERLTALYESSVPEAEKLTQRQKLFAQIQAEYRSLPGPERKNSALATGTLNNAVLLHYLVYMQDLALFEQVYQQNGQNLRVVLERIPEAAEDGEEPFVGVRELVNRLARGDGPGRPSL